MRGDGFLRDVFRVGEVDDGCRSVPADADRLRGSGHQSAHRGDDLLVVHTLARQQIHDWMHMKPQSRGMPRGCRHTKVKYLLSTWQQFRHCTKHVYTVKLHE